MWTHERVKKNFLISRLVENRDLILEPQSECTFSKSTIERPQEICENSSKLTIKIPERRHLRRSNVFRTLNRFYKLSWCFHCWLWTSKYLPGYFINCNPEVLCKRDVLENFTKFTGKHLCHSLFFFGRMRTGTSY